MRDADLDQAPAAQQRTPSGDQMDSPVLTALQERAELAMAEWTKVKRIQDDLAAIERQAKRDHVQAEAQVHQDALKRAAEQNLGNGAITVTTVNSADDQETLAVLTDRIGKLMGTLTRAHRAAEAATTDHAAKSKEAKKAEAKVTKLLKQGRANRRVAELASHRYAELQNATIVGTTEDDSAGLRSAEDTTNEGAVAVLKTDRRIAEVRTSIQDAFQP